LALSIPETNPVAISVPITGPAKFALKFSFRQGYQPQPGSGFSILVDDVTIFTSYTSISHRIIHELAPGDHVVKIQVGPLFPGIYGRLTIDSLRISTSSPILEAPLELELIEGVPVSVACINRGLPGMFSATGLPDGISIDPVTGVISGTPGPGYANYSVQVQVNSPNGASATASVFVMHTSVPNILGTTYWHLAWQFAPFQYVRWGGYANSPYIAFHAPQPATPLLSTRVLGPGTLTWDGAGLDAYVDGVLVPGNRIIPLKFGGQLVEWRARPASGPQAVMRRVSLSGFASWAAQLQLPNSSSPIDDPDGDGLSLAEEYLFNFSPAVADAFRNLEFVPDAAMPDGSLILTWQDPGKSDLPVRLESSTDLLHWNPAALNVLAFDTARYATVPRDLANQYFRLRLGNP
jgi:hypothetical protein